MSRISCDVTKDLLPSYLDEICSEESRELVNEHLQECAECRAFLEEMQVQEMRKDTVKINYMKKINHSMDQWALLAIAASLALLVAGMFIGNEFAPRKTIKYYYFEMPLLMLLFAYLLNRKKKPALPVKWERILPICGAIIVGCTLGGHLYCVDYLAKWHDGIYLLEIPPQWLGPWLRRAALFFAAASVLYLVVLLGITMRANRFFLVSQNMAWLGLNLAMSFEYLLGNMSTKDIISQAIKQNLTILLLEFAAVTLVECTTFQLLPNIRSRKSNAQNNSGQ